MKRRKARDGRKNKAKAIEKGETGEETHGDKRRFCSLVPSPRGRQHLTDKAKPNRARK